MFLGAVAMALIFYHTAKRAPMLKYFCHRCNRAWGHYPDGRLYHQAADRAERFDYWPKVCFKCQSRLHEEDLNHSGKSRLNLSRADAAERGILPEVDRIF